MIHARAIIVPAAVFQSVIVGGAYGTGREIVEFISAYGALGGLGVIAIVGICFSFVLAASFEFARTFKAWDYRHFLKTLLGRGWLAYELMFGALLVVIMAVTGAAAGRVLADAFDIPATAGVALLFLLVVVLNIFGREFVQRTLTIGAIVLIMGLIAYSAAVLSSDEVEIRARITRESVAAGWWFSGIKFAVYNSALIPVLIYCARDLPDRAHALAAGVLAGIFGIMPAMFFHLTFIAGMPAVVDAALPTYWMIERYLPQASILYVVILFATIVQTGVGVLQGLNERLDGWYLDRYGRTLSPTVHGIVAGGVMLVSLLLSQLGLVALVARGYGTLAWGFFFVFTLPLLTVGLRKVAGATRT